MDDEARYIIYLQKLGSKCWMTRRGMYARFYLKSLFADETSAAAEPERQVEIMPSKSQYQQTMTMDRQGGC